MSRKLRALSLTWDQETRDRKPNSCGCTMRGTLRSCVMVKTPRNVAATAQRNLVSHADQDQNIAIVANRKRAEKPIISSLYY